MKNPVYVNSASLPEEKGDTGSSGKMTMDTGLGCGRPQFSTYRAVL